ncbi:MAG: hypothetical protein ACR2G3_00385 [Solirubrobacterales bacterium]
MADLKVVPNEVDGWDVVNVEDGVAVTNYPDRESAEKAAHLRASEDSISEDSEGDVIVDPEGSHGIDDEDRGVKAYFFSVGGLLAIVTVLAIVIALIASLTDFGA